MNDSTTVGILVTLVMLVIGVIWVLIELRKLNDAIGPIANSTVGRALASV